MAIPKNFYAAKKDHMGRFSPYGKEALAAMEYIEMLASRCQVSLESWKIEPFCKPDELADGSYYMIEDRTELNKIFFSLLGPVIADQASLELNAIAAMDVKKVQDEACQIARDMAVADRDRNLERARENYSNYQAFLTRASESGKKAMALEARRAPVTDSINAILRDGYFEFIKAQGNCLIFRNKSDCVLTHENVAAGAKFRVNFGRFHVSLDLATNLLRVFPGERNVNHGGFIHPHVSNNGDICWGDGASTATRKLVEFDYPAVFRILQSVLTNYNDGNPYVGLSTFQRLQPGGAPVNPDGVLPATDLAGQEIALGPAMPSCETCDQSVDDCECYHCGVCDGQYPEDERCNCCTNCNNTERNCVCCSVCGNSDESCDCCRECERSAERCRCDRCPDPDCGQRSRDCGANICSDCDRHEIRCECEPEEESAIPHPLTPGETYVETSQESAQVVADAPSAVTAPAAEVALEDDIAF